MHFEDEQKKGSRNAFVCAVFFPQPHQGGETNILPVDPQFLPSFLPSVYIPDEIRSMPFHGHLRVQQLAVRERDLQTLHRKWCDIDSGVELHSRLDYPARSENTMFLWTVRFCQHSNHAAKTNETGVWTGPITILFGQKGHTGDARNFF